MQSQASRTFLIGVGTSTLRCARGGSLSPEVAAWFSSPAALRSGLRAAVHPLTPEQLLEARELPAAGPAELERVAVERILSQSGPRERGAEIDTLAALDPPPRRGERAVLLISQSSEAALAGRILWRGLRELWGLEVEPRVIGDFDLDRPEVAESRGVYNLFKEATTFLNEPTARPVIIATGGFKVLSSYLTLAGLLHGAEVVYLYEDAPRVLRLPRVRLRPDVRVFCDNLPVFLSAELRAGKAIPWAAVKAEVERNSELEPYLRFFGPMVSLAPLGTALVEHAIDIYSDRLTGAWRQNLFDDGFMPWLARSPSPQGGVLFLDIDHFKKVNDGHGHARGDQVLKEFAGRVLATTSASTPAAHAFRIGGEEFVVSAPGMSRGTVIDLAEEIRKSVREAPVADGLTITVSIGVATWPEDGDPHSPGGLIRVADERMYQAKRTGRDRVVAGDP